MGTPNGGMPTVGTITLALITAEHAAGVPTAIIYAQSEAVDAAKALRDFCVAYNSAKGAVAIVPAFGPTVDTAAAVTREIDRGDPNLMVRGICPADGCELWAGHEDPHGAGS